MGRELDPPPEQTLWLKWDFYPKRKLKNWAHPLTLSATIWLLLCPMILMRHDVLIKWPDNRRENRGINLVCYGDPKGYSAMAKTVGFPCAIATRMVLDKEIQKRGMVLPFTSDIYRPMIDRLKSEGIVATEKS